MRLIFLLFFVISTPALAGDLGQPGGFRSENTVGAQALNRQNFNFGGGGNGPASTPASMFAGQAECQAYVQQAVGVFIFNESTTTPVTLYHCVQAQFASLMGGMAMGFHNIGDDEAARQTLMIARDTLVAGNRDGHLTAKSLGVPIAAAPDEGDAVRFMAGGPILRHVIATPGAPARKPYVPQPAYVPPPDPAPIFNEIHRQEMMK